MDIIISKLCNAYLMSSERWNLSLGSDIRNNVPFLEDVLVTLSIAHNMCIVP
jgi:hypothetical protein